MSEKMRPFRSLVPMRQAVEVLLGAVRQAKDVEEVPVSGATGRVLARAVRSPIDVPAFARSAMDGYAVLAGDTYGATRFDVKALRRVHAIHAGDVTDRSVRHGECIEIATGAMLPPGADAVVRVEDTVAKGDEILVQKPIHPGGNVSKQGGDVRRDETVLEAGELLNPSRIGVLASVGLARVGVYRRPRIAVVPTGNEIDEPGTPLVEGHVYNANAYTLEALLTSHGAEVRRTRLVPDTLAALDAALEEQLDCDLICVSGGSSVGERDLLVDVVARKGTVLYHGVQVRPGKPVVCGTIRDTVVLGLPGYPVSCLTNGYMFVLPALRRIGRMPPLREVTVKARMGERYLSALGRHEFLTVRLEGGKAYSTFKESGALTGMARAMGYIEIPENQDLVEEGDEVEVRLWDF